MPANGPERLAAIAAELRAVGDRGATLALRQGLRAAAKPLIPAVRAAALAKLPHSGGLNRQVAGQRVTVSVRLSARTTDVRLTTSAPDTKQTDEGYVRHPTFGRRGPGSWKTQQVPNAEGWWTDTLKREAAAVGPALAKAVDALAAKIAGA